MEQNISILKKCSKCGIDKELSSQNFTRHSGHKDGFDTQCKECKKIYDQERYKNKRLEILAQKKKYYQKKKVGK
ncbi:hypothetical protein P7D95_09405 [Enterococcus avium]|uniref:hypothetical protein n=1 Tax=Enterococcus avium TaxID=33945 RepID=UPI0028924199|nr:hypothetical protein [Enterococcus avium]MDT2501019.1 hypothetical protein [Enterococcus avium]